MRAADLQPRKAVERTVQDHARQKEGRLERVADDVAEVARSAQRVVADDVVGAHGMDEYQGPELFRFRPERIEFRQRRDFAGDMTRDADAAQAKRFDRFLKLLGGEI